MTAPILVYRDRLGARSEVEFLRRQYVGFDRMPVVWLGRHRDAAADALGETLRMGGDGIGGVLDRALFKTFGTLPSTPDLRALAPRLVHAQFGRGGALALPIARALKIPLVVTMHGGDATKDKHYRRGLLPTIYQRRLPALLQEAALFVCVSAYIRDVLRARGFPDGKLVVNHCGVEIPDALPPRHAGGYVLFAGRFVEKKGAGLMLEAARRLQAAGTPLKLVMVGDGPLAPALKKQAEGLAEVIFPGWVSPAELLRWMQGASALCVPSLTAAGGDSEGLPTVVLEAMALGTPVIASRHAGIPEAVTDGADGLLVEPGDANALAAALKTVHDNPTAAHSMGPAARRTVEVRFNAQTQSRRLEDLLLSVVEKRP
ncbi:MAG: glycosyltransferase [Rhodospirillaceae bacterium]|nr:glycosyltransferase [Rhodospirillaceae bacterium]